VHASIEHDPNRIRPRHSEVRRLCSDTSKAKRLLRWSPSVSLDEGLRLTIEAIRHDLASYRAIGSYQR
jgi:nucleoside-diphosphate-sugar epimerase